ncbi:MAG: DUF4301 family protein [Deltaproteobacteria bacterium]|nr:DUF4301 family protein [Deltaproteobacteria bacterium]
MITDSLSNHDRKRIHHEGLTEEDIVKQLEVFKRGIPPVKLHRPCTIGDGIVVISDAERETLLHLHQKIAQQGKMIKFVPASGAASRMFRKWFQYTDMDTFNTSREGGDFSKILPEFAFYGDLKDTIAQNGRDLTDLIKNRRYKDILKYILTPKGLNYAHLPKALLKFHTYPDHTRTSLEEHLVEAASYVQDVNHICRLHFTISDEHTSEVEELIAHVKEYYETKYCITYDLSLSVQLPSTNTIAVAMDNTPFRDKRGELVFRPGGHGALLKNLNALDYDIIFLKNIDNVIPDRLKPETIMYKQIIGGYLIKLQEKSHAYLRLLTAEQANTSRLSEIIRFCREELFIGFPFDFEDLPVRQKIDIVIDKLNRPFRVCGMVKNQGEPGGGPFWVEEGETQSLQIIEQAQVDLSSEEQKRIWSSSTHFNPVDLVCGVKDYKGQKFDLDRFVDENSYFISQKSMEGRDLKALEFPGLWNGAMARWNTVFVEVPIITFNPVKTIVDLLREEHR